MNPNLNLPPEVQRLLPYIAVAVLAVVGLLLVVRGVNPGSESPATPPAVEQPAKTSPGGGSGAAKGGTPSAKRAQAKRSAEAYVTCVEQATDATALEKCQALVP